MVCTDILQLLACRLLAGLPSSAHLRRPHFKFCAWWSSSGLSASPHSWVVWLSFPHSHYPTIFIRPSWYSTSHIATDASTITSGIVGKATSYLLWAQCLYDVCMKVANNPKFSCLPHARCVMFKLRHSALCFSALYWLSLVLMYFQFYPIVIYVRPSDHVYTLGSGSSCIMFWTLDICLLSTSTTASSKRCTPVIITLFSYFTILWTRGSLKFWRLR